MTRWWRWTLALVVCGVGVVLGPGPSASAAPVTSVGVGSVIADLGVVSVDPHSDPFPESRPGFSPDGAYFAYLVPAADRCDLRLFDVRARTQVGLSNNRVLCDPGTIRWAADADTLVWQVPATAGDVTAYAWDANPGQVSVLAPDAHVQAFSRISADGRFLAFLGLSDTHPAPAVDAPGFAGYVFDRTSGVSLPLSKPDVHVQFEGWSPRGHRFQAETGGHKLADPKTGGCFGSGSSCRVVPVYSGGNVVWSRDGSTVIVGAGSAGGTTVYDFSDGSVTSLTNRVGFDNSAQFLGSDARRVLVRFGSGQATVWDRKEDKVFSFAGGDSAIPSPTGSPILYRPSFGTAWRYLDPTNPTLAGAAYQGTYGYWNANGTSFLGLGPAPGSYPFGCSSLRQW